MSPRLWFVAVAAIVAVIAAAFFFSSPDEAPKPAPVAVAPPPPEPEPEPEKQPPPAPKPEPVVLPSLDDSDAFVREQAAKLAPDDALGRVLATDQLVRKFTTVVENLAQGGIARNALAYLAPSKPFTVLRSGDSIRIDPASYHRYDDLAASLAELDPGQAVSMLRLIEPLMDDAYRELGVQDADVDARIRAGIDVLLATPDVTGPVELKQPAVMYDFADPKLQALRPAQKLLIRMGADNAAKVRAKLREIRARLG